MRTADPERSKGKAASPYNRITKPLTIKNRGEEKKDSRIIYSYSSKGKAGSGPAFDIVQIGQTSFTGASRNEAVAVLPRIERRADWGRLNLASGTELRHRTGQRRSSGWHFWHLPNHRPRPLVRRPERIDIVLSTHLRLGPARMGRKLVGFKSGRTRNAGRREQQSGRSG